MYTQSYFVEIKNNEISIKNDKLILPELNSTEILCKINYSLLSCQSAINDKKDGLYSAAQQISGIVEKVGSSVKKFKYHDQILGFIPNEKNCSGLSQYCIISEDFCYHYSSSHSETAVALLKDFFIAQLSLIRLPKFPKPHTFLILNPTSPLGHIFIHLLRQTKFKIIAYTDNIKECNDLQTRYSDIVVLNDSTQSLFTLIMDETFNIGVSCIFDLLNGNEFTCSSDSSSIPAKDIIDSLSLGGSLVSFSPATYASPSLLKVLYNKSASIIFPHLNDLLLSKNYTERMTIWAEDLMKQIDKHELKPKIIQSIKFSDVSVMLCSENIETLSRNYRVVVVH